MTTFDAEDHLLLLPGPVKMHPRVLRAMSRPALGHRTPEFRAVLKRMTEGMRYLFQTKETVLALSGSATLGMEAAVSNVARRGDRVLVLQNGKFGQRFSNIAAAYAGDGAVVVETPMGSPWDLDRAAEELAKGDVKVVAAVANESSAGIRNDVEALAKLVRGSEALFVLDGVTAVGGMNVPLDKWNVDACIVGSQKCIGGPAGATLLALSDRYIESASHHGFYLDLKRAAEKWNDGDTPFTPATHLFFGIAEALDLLADETLATRIGRCEKMMRATRAALAAARIPLLVADDHASPTITAGLLPDGVTDTQVRGVLKDEFGVVLAGAQDELKGKAFRIGHMGFVQPREIVAAIACLEHALARAGYSSTPGVGVNAFFSAWTQAKPAAAVA